jgi:polysaccharide export outer membrane protein
MHTGKILHTLLLASLFTLGCEVLRVTKDNPRLENYVSEDTVFAGVRSSKYVIREGDNIQIVVWGYPEFNTTATVKEGGSVTVPLIGDIQAANQTKENFTGHLRRKLSEYIQGDVKLTVTIVSSQVYRVAVLGEVRRPENYPVNGDVSLVEILSAAGGTNPDSDLNRIKIIRNNGRKDNLEVDLAKHVENGSLENIPKVRPGDIVFVPKKENVVRDVSEFIRDVILLFGFFRILN